jgi:hypothetical protein
LATTAFYRTTAEERDFLNHVYDYIENTSVFELNQEEGPRRIIPTGKQGTGLAGIPQPFDGITFNFDYATSGVGCTARSVFNQYRVLPTRYDFVVRVRPVSD